MRDSSPLTRGKRIGALPHDEHLGLIPAHARKTVPCRLVCPCWWAHPRSCGENCASGPSSQGISGSSPLTRGKHVRSDVDVVAAGLIPAHAGKTVRRRRTLRSRRAHPCSRREKSTFSTPVGSMSGSSPLTQGKLQQAASLTRLRGLIPAHAGKTPTRAFSWRRSTAHPRSRGENERDWMRRNFPEGSSPLTQGKQPRTILGRRTERLIPAHAGKTA